MPLLGTRGPGLQNKTMCVYFSWIEIDWIEYFFERKKTGSVNYNVDAKI